MVSKYITFSANLDEPSRVKLYDTFQKNIGKYTKKYVYFTQKFEDGYKIYKFKRVDND